jgi:hypothetical protein
MALTNVMKTSTGAVIRLIIDARIKPHHAPILEKNAVVEKRVDEILKKYL